MQRIVRAAADFAGAPDMPLQVVQAKATTMWRFDEACLTPVRLLLAAEIRALREREGAGQAVFACCLNVTTGLVSQWGRGEKQPRGASLKLLSVVVRHGLGTVA
jgi:putative transcriptional regulator